jgi:hypothetical protein
MIAVPVYRDARTDETMQLQAETILNADPVHGPRIVEKVMVITFYAAQARRLQDRLRSA